MATTIIESLFQRSLDDVVKGLRVQMIGEVQFFSKVLDEIRKEIKSMDVNTKSVALQKLTYLNMLLGTDMAWAAFHVVEVMSLHKFSLKKLGYLAASQSFNESTDVLLLITNLLRKDFGGKNEYEASLAMECLTRVANPSLARDLMPELFSMLASGRPFVRKKATIALWRVFTQYPDAIRVALKRLIERLSDDDPAVVTASISVLCDLAMKDPKPFLPLAPELYNLLVRSPNNWLCIKLVKVLGLLAPLEPRLGKKIAEPICELMRKSEAKSVVLECIQTITAGLTDHPGAVKLCVEKLKELMAEDDANLKYLCLRALGNLMVIHPGAVSANKEAIAKCLNHKDPSIQKGARRLIIGMVSESNMMATVHVLMQHAYSADSDSCNELVSSILSTCSSDHYALIWDFSWYLSVLVEMARIPQCDCGDEIGRQLIDIGMRVKSATGEVLKAGRDLLLEPARLDRLSVQGVLSSAAWIAGEYVAYSTNLNELVEALLQPRTMALPASVRALCVQAVFKVFVHTALEFFGKELPHFYRSTGENSHHMENLALDEDKSEAEFIGRNSPLRKEGNPARNVSVLGSEPQFMDESFNLEAEESSRKRVSEQNLESEQRRASQTDYDWQHEGVINGDEEREFRAGSRGQGKVVITGEKEGNLVEFLKPTIELMAENMTAMRTSSDVEVQERACSLFGLIQVIKDTSTSPSPDPRASPEEQGFSQILDALLGVLTVELSPVSVHAQGRVTAPEGLILENLDALGPSGHTEEVVVEGIIGREAVPEWEGRKVFSFQGSSTPAVGESATLLAQHRQRHQNFYLPAGGKSEANSLSYPPPQVAYQDPIPLSFTQSTRSGLFGEDTKVTTRLKARPLVVKLDDEEDDHFKSSFKVKKKDFKDEFVSNAIMDVLAGGARSSHKYQGPAAQGLEGGQSSRTRQHRSHGSRSSRHLERDSSFSHQASSRAKDGSAPERESSLASEMDGNPTNLGEMKTHSDAIGGDGKNPSKHKGGRAKKQAREVQRKASQH